MYVNLRSDSVLCITIVVTCLSCVTSNLADSVMKRFFYHLFFCYSSLPFSAAICASCLIPLTNHITSLTVELIQLAHVEKKPGCFCWVSCSKKGLVNTSTQDKQTMQKEIAKMSLNSFSWVLLDLFSRPCI